MNKKQYLAPVLALVIVATWLFYLRTSTASMTRDNIALEKKLHSSGNTSDTLSAIERTKKAQAGNSAALNTSSASIDTSRDWKKLAQTFLAAGKADGGTAKMAAWNQLVPLIAAMSNDELMAAYLEIAGLPSSSSNRWYLENEMLKILELKNPEFAFSQHIERFEKNDKLTDGIGRFHLWLERDPTTATAWYEGEVAKGTFDKTLDGKSRLRLPFESAFVRSLLTTDPAAAQERVNHTPPEQRKELLVSYIVPSETNAKALIDLVRNNTPKEGQASLVASMAVANTNLNDTAKVLENFARIDATPEERSALLQMEVSRDAHMRIFDSARMKQYREWSLAIDPSSADRSTGLAFAKYANVSQRPQDFEYLTKLAIDYHAIGAGDDFIIGLVEGSGTSRTPLPLENARALAMKIADQTRRDEILEKLK